MDGAEQFCFSAGKAWVIDFTSLSLSLLIRKVGMMVHRTAVKQQREAAPESGAVVITSGKLALFCVLSLLIRATELAPVPLSPSRISSFPWFLSQEGSLMSGSPPIHRVTPRARVQGKDEPLFLPE